MTKFSKYIGLDTHKDTIAVAIAEAGQNKPRYYGEIANTPEAVAKLVKKRPPGGSPVVLLRGRSLRLRDPPAADPSGPYLRRSRPLTHPAQSGRSGEDRPPG